RNAVALRAALLEQRGQAALQRRVLVLILAGPSLGQFALFVLQSRLERDALIDEAAEVVRGHHRSRCAMAEPATSRRRNSIWWRSSSIDLTSTTTLSPRRISRAV